MKKKIKIGARVLGPKKVEALSAREENQKHKARFKAGAFAATDPNAGRPNGRLIPSHQNPTPPASEESTDVTK
jgi:hypothetical protein